MKYLFRIRMIVGNKETKTNSCDCNYKYKIIKIKFN